MQEPPATPAPAVQSDDDPPTVGSGGETEIQWDQAWLVDNWQAVIDALGDAKQMPVAGVVGPAKVIGLSGGVLSLEYSGDYEGLRRRGVKINDDINRIFTALAGMEITCKLVPADIADSQGPAQRAFGGLSTAETTEIAKDPAVKVLIDAFAGTLLDARRDPTAGLPPADTTELLDDEDD